MLFETGPSEDQKEAESGQDRAVTHITEHNAKEEWEGRDSHRGRVSLLVLWYTVSINDQLEAGSSLICLYIGRSLNTVVVVSDHSHCWEYGNLAHDLLFLLCWSPKVSNECRVLHLHHVERLI